MGDYQRQNDWRAELIRVSTSKSYGRFNHSDLNFGSETATVDDPEDGAGIPIGGKQTAEDTTLSRPWKRSRDRATYNELKALRGTQEVFTLNIHDLDDLGNPVSSTPLESLTVYIQEVTPPEGDKSGTDASTITIKVSVKA